MHGANACTVPTTKKDGTSVRTKTPAYDIPYIPSMKSLPCTSFSEETLQMNLKNKLFCNSNQKRTLKLIQNEAENSKQISTEDKLLKILNHCKNIKKIAPDIENNNSLRDYDNVDIITGDQFQSETVITEHTYNKNIIDSVESTQSFVDSKPTNSLILASQQSYLSNESGENVTKTNFVIHEQDTFDGSSNNNQNSILNLFADNKKKFGKHELNGADKNTSTENQQNHEKKEQTFVLFDCNKYPLTDSQGKTLKTASGKNLVKFKNGKPYDCFGRAVFDPSGNPSSSKKFKPFLKVTKKKKMISTIPLFDFRGFCLIDFDGSSLTNADGYNLIQVDNKGKILYDINKHPIFDKNGIPITKQNGLWLSPKGNPMRVFDKTKHPLTNKHGEPLRDKKLQELLKCDQHGRPLFDCNNEPIFDATGTSATESKFNPTREPLKSDIILTVMLENKPAQLFNRKGWPLTEKNGEVMHDSNGHCLLMLKKVNPNEITDYDQLLFRLNDPVPLTEISLYLPETKLTREDEIKSNNKNLKKKKIVLDLVGHPLSDRFKGNVLDKNGRKIFLNIKTYFMDISNGPSSTNVYISEETQTLDSSKAKKSQLKLDSISFSADVISFQTETDLFGRPLHDSFNHPLFDKYGRPMYDLFGRSIYNSKGQPVATADAIRLDNGLDEAPGIKIGFNTSLLIPQDPNNLPKLTDLNGGPLFDSLGFPLYNKKGKPLIDAYGRPLYDENGLPQCDQEGRPMSKLVKQRNVCILSVEDKIETLQSSPLRTSVKKASTRDRVLTHNKTTREAAEMHQNDDLDTSQLMKSLIVRIRVTTFIDGKKQFEILESVPSP
ncbi:uncharacterized protein [Halyomorpha halys]|nr:uncharacterized protein LOC106689566 isoform X2 [Halyomorpha halys]XP_014290118.1 uncharacterized protein LOC106689566 isoform X2 [Halyomorpha halys]